MKEKLKRPCIRCNKDFQPTGTSCRVCDVCLRRATIERWKKIYFGRKEELDKIRHNATLQKWKVLSKAYILGKKIWGNNFNLSRLSYDMDMPLSTVQRCLALDRANKRSMVLMNQGKISSFKLAMICALKNSKYQDKIVDMVIEDDISTCKIKKLKADNIADLNIQRHQIAVEKGYSRQDSAYYNFNTWINRGITFMLMDKKALPEKKLNEIEDKLKKLNEMINKYIDNGKQ